MFVLPNSCSVIPADGALEWGLTPGHQDPVYQKQRCSPLLLQPKTLKSGGQSSLYRSGTLLYGT
jgi:hypothetical protein